MEIEEDKNNVALSAEIKIMLDERLQEDEATYLTAEESLMELEKKYRM